MHRHLRFALCLVVLFTSLLTIADEADAAKRPPNIVFFLVDDMGWNDTEPYGNKFHETPNVTKLAKQGMRFTNAYAACPVCSPTRASIMSGKYPATLNLTDFIPGHWRPYEKLVVPKMNLQLPLKEVSLAECVKPAGYITGSFGKWHLGGPSHYPGQQGFDDWVVTGGRHFAPNFRTTPKKEVKKGEYLGDFLTRQAERFMEENRDKPFLLYLPHYAVHIPLEAKQKLVEKYAKKLSKSEFRPKVVVSVRAGIAADIARIGNHPLGTVDREIQNHPLGRQITNVNTKNVSLRLVQNVYSFKKSVSFDDLQKFVIEITTKFRTVKMPPGYSVEIKLSPVNHPTYAAMVEHIDQSLGRIMKKLDDLKLADNTILIFFSDNGGLYRRFDERGPAVMSNHPLRAEKGTVYEGGIREPCIIRWPGKVKPGTTCDVPISSVDFWPTIAEISGTAAKHTHKVDGVSLLPLLKQTGSLADRALYWHYPHYHHMAPAGAIRYGDYKLIENFETNELELYNLSKDIGESNNLIGSDPRTTKKLHDMLKAWRKKVGARMPTLNPNFDPKRRYEWKRRPRPRKKPQGKKNR
ncbi:MAG: hypothetical protein Tsb009_08710 [Planctomycetaceae bacterium]